jgi:hypothetical protein
MLAGVTTTIINGIVAGITTTINNGMAAGVTTTKIITFKQLNVSWGYQLPFHCL